MFHLPSVLRLFIILPKYGPTFSRYCSIDSSSPPSYSYSIYLSSKASVIFFFCCFLVFGYVVICSCCERFHGFFLEIALRKKCSYSELFWSAFSVLGLNTEKYSVSLRVQSECGKIRTRVTPNTGTFYTLLLSNFFTESGKCLINQSYHSYQAYFDNGLLFVLAIFSCSSMIIMMGVHFLDLEAGLGVRF